MRCSRWYLTVTIFRALHPTRSVLSPPVHRPALEPLDPLHDQLALPGPSPPRDALITRPRKHDDGDAPLPVKMLSVPHPSGRSSLGGPGASAAATGNGVTPAKLPPSRWAQRSDNNGTPSASSSGGRKETTQQGSSEGGGGGAKAHGTPAAAAAASDDSSPVAAPGSRKRKTSDAHDSGTAAAGDGNAAAAGTGADGSGHRGGGKNDTGGGGAEKGGARAQGNDTSDEPAVEPHRTKRARTNSEVDRLAKQQQHSSPASAPGKSGSSPHPPASADKAGDANRRTPSSSPRPPSAPAATSGGTPGKGKDGTGGGKTDAGVANGAPTTPGGGGKDDTLAEEARRLEARRRERSARSPYVYGGVGRADPTAGLPKSVRLLPAAFARGGEVVAVDSKAATPAKSAPKVYTINI